jgi:hypothetical protein
MKRALTKTNGKLKSATQKKATELLEWMIDFLPATILPTLEKAVLDESGEVHALFWHRSELQYLLAKEPEALNALQLGQLAELDKKSESQRFFCMPLKKGRCSVTGREDTTTPIGGGFSMTFSKKS